MATNEDIDEAEELRFLALQSMVKRSKQNNPRVETDDTDDQDILLLRAAALKTITHKNTQNSSLVNKNDKFVKNQISRKKRSIDDQVSSVRKKTYLKLNERENNDLMDNTNAGVSTNIEQKNKHKLFLEPNAETQSKPVALSKYEAKKTVRNGSIQLSNLDSKTFDETLVVRVTFSSSESDGSSSECDIIGKKVQKDTVHNRINNGIIKPQVPMKNVVVNHSKTVNPKSLEDNRIKINNCMQQICGLMKNCESEIENRNQQLKILLEAYEKYQNYSKSLYSILQSMKAVREELSIYNALETEKTNE